MPLIVFMEEVDIESLSMGERFLVRAAQSATELAHVPNSGLRTGAAIETEGHSNGFIRGANFENSSVSGSHAARSAIVVAQSRGLLEKIRKIAVAGEDADSTNLCDRCVLDLIDLEKVTGHPLTVIMAGTGESVRRVVGAANLVSWGKD